MVERRRLKAETLQEHKIKYAARQRKRLGLEALNLDIRPVLFTSSNGIKSTKPDSECKAHVIFSDRGLVQSFPWDDTGRRAQPLDKRVDRAERTALRALVRWGAQQLFDGQRLWIEKR